MLKKKETITQNHINKVLLKNYTCFFDTYRYESQIMSNTLVSYDIMTFSTCKFLHGVWHLQYWAVQLYVALKVAKPANFYLVCFTSLNPIWAGHLTAGNNFVILLLLPGITIIVLCACWTCAQKLEAHPQQHAHGKL